MDALAAPAVLDGREAPAAAQAAALLVRVAGQDLDEGKTTRSGSPGRWRRTRSFRHSIPRPGLAARPPRGVRRYKGHVGIDPDAEMVTATTVAAGTPDDFRDASELLSDELPASGDDAAGGGSLPGTLPDCRIRVFGS